MIGHGRDAIRSSPAMKMRSGSCLGWDKGDLVAEAIEAADQGAGRALAVRCVEMIGAEIFERGAGGEHVIGGDQDLVPDRDGGAQWASPGAQAKVFVLEVAAGLARGGHCRGDQGCLEVPVAFADVTAVALAGALVIAGAYVDPGSSMGGARKHRHV